MSTPTLPLPLPLPLPPPSVSAPPRRRMGLNLSLPAPRYQSPVIPLSAEASLAIRERPAIPRGRLYEIFKHPSGGILFLSDVESAKSEELLRRHRIQAVVNACSILTECQSPTYPAFDFITYLNVELEDNADANLTPAICRTQEFINTNLLSGRNVLVHCQAGISRSVSLIMAYLILHQYGWLEALPNANPSSSPDSAFGGIDLPIVTKALEVVQRAKPNANPNISFMVQLNRLARYYTSFVRSNCTGRVYRAS